MTKIHDPSDDDAELAYDPLDLIATRAVPARRNEAEQLPRWPT